MHPAGPEKRPRSSKPKRLPCRCLAWICSIPPGAPASGTLLPVMAGADASTCWLKSWGFPLPLRPPPPKKVRSSLQGVNSNQAAKEGQRPLPRSHGLPKISEASGSKPWNFRGDAPARGDLSTWPMGLIRLNPAQVESRGVSAGCSGSVVGHFHPSSDANLSF